MLVNLQASSSCMIHSCGWLTILPSDGIARWDNMLSVSVLRGNHISSPSLARLQVDEERPAHAQQDDLREAAERAPWVLNKTWRVRLHREC